MTVISEPSSCFNRCRHGCVPLVCPWRLTLLNTGEQARRNLNLATGTAGLLAQPLAVSCPEPLSGARPHRAPPIEAFDVAHGLIVIHAPLAGSGPARLPVT